MTQADHRVAHPDAPSSPAVSVGSGVWRSGAQFAGASLAAFVAAALAGIINARLLGPELLGVWSTAGIVLAYLPFLPLGVDHAAARDIPLLGGAGRSAEADQVKHVYFSLALLVAVVSALAIVVYAAFATIPPLLRWSLIVVAVLGVVTSIGRWAIVLLKADSNFGWAGLADSLRSLCLVLAIPLVYWFGLVGVWIGNLLGGVASLALAWRTLRFRPRLRWDGTLLRRLAGFGAPIMAASIAQTLSLTGDKMLVLGFLGTGSLGVYALGRNFGQVLVLSGGVVGPVLYPRIAERFGKTQDVTTLANLIVAPSLLLGATLPAVTALAWFTLPVAIEWFLPAFRSGILSAQILFVATAAYLLCGSSVYLLLTLERQVLVLVLFGASVVLGLVLEFVALRSGFGLGGVAAGVGVSNLIYAVVIAAVAQRLCRVPPRVVAWNLVNAALPLIATVVLCLAVDALWPPRPPVPILAAAAQAIASAVIVAVCCLPWSLVLLNRAVPDWRQLVQRRFRRSRGA
jgi:stage V sporulation protein B